MRSLVLAVLVSVVLPPHPVVLGVSKPSESLTAARVMATLPKAEQKPWLEYLKRSEAQEAVDKAALAAERAKLTGPIPPLPRESGSGRSMPLERDAAFYKSEEALHTAQTIVSFQIPNGGWSKNLDMTGPPRLPGQSYTPNNISRFLGPDDFDKPANPDWNYVGTLDNDATNTELHFLAKVAAAHPGADGDVFRKSFLRGVDYLLRSQYPNGGWPQVWPLEGRVSRRHHLQRQCGHGVGEPAARRVAGRGRVYLCSGGAAKAGRGGERARDCDHPEDASDYRRQKDRVGTAARSPDPGSGGGAKLRAGGALGWRKR